MPRAGSQVILCDLPVRFDTYTGCTHNCQYCFVSRKYDISKIKRGESASNLLKFIKGERTKETEIFDWDIPLHWGGVSDPFQPVEKVRGYSLEALKVFANTGYPFAVSTKSSLISQGQYLELVKNCNCVVQFSACSPRYDRIEKGAATFEQRLTAAEKIAPHRRVNIRVQPYIPEIFNDVISLIPRLADIGVYGLIVEGMKYKKAPIEGLCQIGTDLCYPASTLIPQFKRIKETCHKYGLHFYSGENRLRLIGDDLCCCGVDGLGWRVNTANLNHLLFAPDSVEFSDKMKQTDSVSIFSAIHQKTEYKKNAVNKSFRGEILHLAKNPYPFIEPAPAFTESQKESMRGALCAALKKSGHTRAFVDKYLGTNGMSSHYFGRSQWMLPSAEAWSKLSQIMPLIDREIFIQKHTGKKYVSKIFTKI